MIYMISALSNNNVIGKDNDLVIRDSDDLKHFKATTIDKTIVMGRKTFESLGSKPLPKRRNIVISRTYTEFPGCETLSVEEVLELAKSEDIYIIGGGEIYSIFMEYADGLILSIFDKNIDGDTYFPSFSEGWTEVERIYINDSFYVSRLDKKKF